MAISSGHLVLIQEAGIRSFQLPDAAMISFSFCSFRCLSWYFFRAATYSRTKSPVPAPTIAWPSNTMSLSRWAAFLAAERADFKAHGSCCPASRAFCAASSAQEERTSLRHDRKRPQSGLHSALGRGVISVPSYCGCAVSTISFRAPWHSARRLSISGLLRRLLSAATHERGCDCVSWAVARRTSRASCALTCLRLDVRFGALDGCFAHTDILEICVDQLLLLP
jgi:hypothetical protein